jgi:hypothetical protein
MKPPSYRFVVARDGDFPALGLLREWPDGNEAALRHLEDSYPNWTQITIQKVSEATTQPNGQGGDFGGLPKGGYRNRGVRSFA